MASYLSGLSQPKLLELAFECRLLMRPNTGSTDKHKMRLFPFTLNALHVIVDNTGTLLVACYNMPGTDVNHSELTTKHELMYLIVLMCELCLTKLVGSFEIQICQY